MIHSYFIMILMIMNEEFVIDINLCYSFQMTNRMIFLLNLNRKTNQLKHGSTSKFVLSLCVKFYFDNALQAGRVRVGLTTPSPTAEEHLTEVLARAADFQECSHRISEQPRRLRR